MGVFLRRGKVRALCASKALQVELVTPDAPHDHTTDPIGKALTGSANTPADVPVAGSQSSNLLRRKVPMLEIEILCAFYACVQRRPGAFRTSSGVWFSRYNETLIERLKFTRFIS